MNSQDKFDCERYKKLINEDFARFIRLERAWIANISHKIMPTQNTFEHIDRKKLRKELLYYLNRKMKGHLESAEKIPFRKSK